MQLKLLELKKKVLGFDVIKNKDFQRNMRHRYLNVYSFSPINIIKVIY